MRFLTGSPAWAAAVLLLSASAHLRSAGETAGPQITTFESKVDDSDQPYGLYVPPKLDRTKKYPLVVMLHGHFTDHRTELKRLFGRGAPNDPAMRGGYWPNFPETDVLAVTPHARGALGYWGIGERDVMDVIADVQRRFPVDTDRIYLTGVGTGAGGALALALRRPGFFAAVVPVSPIAPPNLESLIPNARNLPVRIYQGAADPLAKPYDSQSLAESLRASGAVVEYIELKGYRHNVWEAAYREGAVFDWLARFRRQPHPEAVSYVTDNYEHAEAYWMRFTQLTPGLEASANARFTARKRLAITTKALDGLQLNLQHHPMATGAGFLQVTVDGSRLNVPPGKPVLLARSANGWSLRSQEPKPGEKRNGLEGPLHAAVADRHVYVYGTADGASPSEILRRREEASKAADWDRTKTTMLVSFRVVSDAELTQDDRAQSNLFLFGDAQSNRIIAELAPKLPMQLSPAAADYGLLYIAPGFSGRYVVVSSGLPWWNRVDQVNGRPGIPMPYQLLPALGDFALYRGKGDNFLVQGRFDRQWKLSKAQADALRASSVVTINPASVAAEPAPVRPVRKRK
jgi:poly(3-hydroxybutyrate) depolymerase